MGVVDVLGPLAARPRPGEVPDERQGGVPHVPADVLRQGPARRQAPLQGLPDQTRPGPRVLMTRSRLPIFKLVAVIHYVLKSNQIKYLHSTLKH